MALLAALAALFEPAPAITRLPAERIAHAYRRHRYQTFTTVFFGYAVFYFVRKNFSLAKPYLINELHFTTGDVGLIATVLSLAYGVSKFVMGNVSDRSNPRTFMAVGLILSGAINVLFGSLSGLWLMALLWFVNGWVQGMGWPPCGRTLTHWFSDRERGTVFAFWNTAHNIGGGLIGPICSLSLLFIASWRGFFFIPGVLAILSGLAVLVFLRDTPQSVGLPPVEEFKNDYPAVAVDDRERELSGREILVNHVLNNRTIWLIACATAFVYVVRYGVLDWAPTYLTKVKHASPDLSRWQFFLYEWAGIPGTLLAGWVSDRLFRGRRAPIAVIYMGVVALATLLYWWNPPGRFWVDSIALLAIGFFIYGPVMLVSVAAIDLVPKKAAGTAAGFVGLFGYVGGATIAELGIGKVVQYWSWDGGFLLIGIACLLALVLFAFTWNIHDRAVIVRPAGERAS